MDTKHIFGNPHLPKMHGLYKWYIHVHIISAEYGHFLSQTQQLSSLTCFHSQVQVV